MKKIFFLLIVAISTICYAGNIFVVTSKHKADVKVYVTNIKTQADLLVYQEGNKHRAKGKDEIWHMVNSKHKADVKIYFVKTKSQADLIIYYVNSKSQAGWKKSNKFRGRLI